MSARPGNRRSRAFVAAFFATPLFLFAIAIFASAVAPVARADFAVPRLTSAVVDGAGILSSDSRTRLEASLQVLKKNTGTHLAVLTVPDLGGLSIEQASIQVAEAWKLGSEREDNGVEGSDQAARPRQARASRQATQSP